MKSQELFERLNNLKHVPRTGWLLCNVPLGEVEDVAQHTFDVAAMTLVLADVLERRKMKIDQKKALCMAVVHDWAEALVGDFPYPALRYLKSRGTKKRIEQNALNDLLHDLPMKEKYLGLWQEYSKKRTPEAKLVHAADYLSMLVQAVKYRERGNRSRELEELWHAVERDLQPYAGDFPWINNLVAGLRKRFLIKRSHAKLVKA